ncbi:MAG TPA: M23 family metallopeptidase [Gammaproteobacteria bacterium]|nr:M23 family metallopeptidase [Gammaproteobacteria bacterium]
MQLILLSRNRGHLGQLRVTSRRLWVVIASTAVVLAAGAFYVGFNAANAVGVQDPLERITVWRRDLHTQQAELEHTRRMLQQKIDALALRLGQMNAHVVRLDALGARLTQMAGLEDGEFDFSSPPSLGGPEDPLAETDSSRLGDIMASLDSLSSELSDRERQLGVLEDLLLHRKLRNEVYPKGRPVTAGYISSRFGKRTDPFTGREGFHKGLDFAGRAGSEVIAVASGIVVWSGTRFGYGQMVEIDHGNGYVTRYAHNSRNIVSVGEKVKRGQVIAQMGETGRATGPNLHFEVLHDGQAVDPLTYLH